MDRVTEEQTRSNKWIVFFTDVTVSGLAPYPTDRTLTYAFKRETGSFLSKKKRECSFPLHSPLESLKDSTPPSASSTTLLADGKHVDPTIQNDGHAIPNLLKAGQTSMEFQAAGDVANWAFFEISLRKNPKEIEYDTELRRKGIDVEVVAEKKVVELDLIECRADHAREGLPFVTSHAHPVGFDVGALLNSVRKKNKKNLTSFNHEVKFKQPGRGEDDCAIMSFQCRVAESGAPKFLMLLELHSHALEDEFSSKKQFPRATAALRHLLVDLSNQIRGAKTTAATPVTRARSLSTTAGGSGVATTTTSGRFNSSPGEEGPLNLVQLSRLIEYNLPTFIATLRTTVFSIVRDRDKRFYELCLDIFNQTMYLRGKLSRTAFDDSQEKKEVDAGKKELEDASKHPASAAAAISRVMNNEDVENFASAAADATIDTIIPQVSKWSSSPRTQKLFGAIAGVLSSDAVKTVCGAFPVLGSLMAGVSALLSMFQAMDDMEQFSEMVMSKIFAMLQVLKNEQLKKFIEKNPPCLEKFKDVYCAIEDITDFIREHKKKNTFVRFVISGADFQELEELHEHLTQQFDELHQICSLFSISQQDEILRGLVSSADESHAKLDTLQDTLVAQGAVTTSLKEVAHSIMSKCSELEKNSSQRVTKADVENFIAEFETRAQEARSKVSDHIQANIASLKEATEKGQQATTEGVKDVQQQLLSLNTLVTGSIMDALDMGAMDRDNMKDRLKITDKKLAELFEVAKVSADKVAKILQSQSRTEEDLARVILQMDGQGQDIRKVLTSVEVHEEQIANVLLTLEQTGSDLKAQANTLQLGQQTIVELIETQNLREQERSRSLQLAQEEDRQTVKELQELVRQLFNRPNASTKLQMNPEEASKLLPVIRGHLEIYYKRRFNKLSIIENEDQTELDFGDTFRISRLGGSAGGEDNTSTTVKKANEWVQHFEEQFESGTILVEGQAGVGKSSMAKYLAREQSCSLSRMILLVDLPSLFAELEGAQATLSRELLIELGLQEFHKYSKKYYKKGGSEGTCPEESVKEVAALTPIFWIFDGFDEISGGSQKSEKVNKTFRLFLSEVFSNSGVSGLDARDIVFITSREERRGEIKLPQVHASQNCFRLRLEPWTLAEAEDFILKVFESHRQKYRGNGRAIIPSWIDDAEHNALIDAQQPALHTWEGVPLMYDILCNYHVKQFRERNATKIDINPEVLLKFAVSKSYERELRKATQLSPDSHIKLASFELCCERAADLAFQSRASSRMIEVSYPNNLQRQQEHVEYSLARLGWFRRSSDQKELGAEGDLVSEKTTVRLRFSHQSFSEYFRAKKLYDLLASAKDTKQAITTLQGENVTLSLLTHRLRQERTKSSGWDTKNDSQALLEKKIDTLLDRVHDLMWSKYESEKSDYYDLSGSKKIATFGKIIAQKLTPLQTKKELDLYNDLMKKPDSSLPKDFTSSINMKLRGLASHQELRNLIGADIAVEVASLLQAPEKLIKGKGKMWKHSVPYLHPLLLVPAARHGHFQMVRALSHYITVDHVRSNNHALPCQALVQVHETLERTNLGQASNFNEFFDKCDSKRKLSEPLPEEKMKGFAMLPRTFGIAGSSTRESKTMSKVARGRSAGSTDHQSSQTQAAAQRRKMDSALRDSMVPGAVDNCQMDAIYSVSTAAWFGVNNEAEQPASSSSKPSGPEQSREDELKALIKYIMALGGELSLEQAARVGARRVVERCAVTIANTFAEGRIEVPYSTLRRLLTALKGSLDTNDPPTSFSLIRVLHKLGTFWSAPALVEELAGHLNARSNAAADRVVNYIADHVESFALSGGQICFPCAGDQIHQGVGSLLPSVRYSAVRFERSANQEVFRDVRTPDLLVLDVSHTETLSDSVFFNDTAMTEFLLPLRLQSFNCNNTDGRITDRTLRSLLKNCRKLHTLCIGGCEGSITDSCFAEYPPLHLKHLDISYTSFSSSILQQWVFECKRVAGRLELEVLNLRGTAGSVNDMALIEILKCCRHTLLELDVSETSGMITDYSMQYLRPLRLVRDFEGSEEEFDDLNGRLGDRAGPLKKLFVEECDVFQNCEGGMVNPWSTHGCSEGAKIEAWLRTNSWQESEESLSKLSPVTSRMISHIVSGCEGLQVLHTDAAPTGDVGKIPRGWEKLIEIQLKLRSSSHPPRMVLNPKNATSATCRTLDGGKYLVCSRTKPNTSQPDQQPSPIELIFGARDRTKKIACPLQTGLTYYSLCKLDISGHEEFSGILPISSCTNLQHLNVAKTTVRPDFAECVSRVREGSTAVNSVLLSLRHLDIGQNRSIQVGDYEAISHGCPSLVYFDASWPAEGNFRQDVKSALIAIRESCALLEHFITDGHLPLEEVAGSAFVHVAPPKVRKAQPRTTIEECANLQSTVS